ncbi:MAG: hypothetical protein K0R92_3107 [Lachnospiraceae bacterium]|jgi:hypothetical protein|nr:hypothetical protein [Lachnospiraceae bacterium]
MKKRLYPVMLLCLLPLLTACQKAPDEVTVDINTDNNVEQGNKDIKYDALENIYKTIYQVRNTVYDNLEFTTDFTINMPESIGLLRLKQTEHFFKRNPNILDQFVDNINPDVKIVTDGFYPPALEYQDIKGKESFSAGDNGFFYHENEKYDTWLKIKNNDLGDFTLYDTIYLQINASNQTFQWENNVITLDSIVEKGTSYGNELSLSYNDMDWIPQEVKVYQYKNGEFFFEVAYTKAYHEVLLFYNDWGNNTNARKEPYVHFYQPYVVLDSNLEVISTNNLTGIIEYMDTKEPYDEIITLEYATNALSTLLSSYRKYEIQWISLEYRLVYETDDGSNENVRNTAFPGKIYETRPCWTFYLKSNSNIPAFATVDCVTGYIEFVSKD